MAAAAGRNSRGGVVFCAGVERVGLQGMGSRRQSGSLAAQRLHFMREIYTYKTCNGARKDGGRVDFLIRSSAYLQRRPTAGTPAGKLDLALISGPGSRSLAQAPGPGSLGLVSRRAPARRRPGPPTH